MKDDDDGDDDDDNDDDDEDDDDDYNDDDDDDEDYDMIYLYCSMAYFIASLCGFQSNPAVKKESLDLYYCNKHCTLS